MNNLLLYTLCYFVVINLISFVTMFYDKKQAIKNRYRISEKTLFTLAFLLGGVGIYLGMVIFRHKTKHITFKLFIPIIICINFSILIYIFIKSI